jgi:iron complex outermembrane receptor protein
MKNFCRYFWIILFSLLLVKAGAQEQAGIESWPSVETADTFRIQGRIVDAETGEALPYVAVGLKENEAKGVSANEEGFFEIPGLKSGVYRLWASCVGYEEKVSDPVILSGRSPGELVIGLSPGKIVAHEVVVTASLRPQTVRLAPASVGLVTREQLDEKNITTFDQAFDEVPGVIVTRSSGANVQALSIRGASEVAGGGIGNRVMLLIDGRPAISPESGGALWNLVPMASVERIEVVKGAYSSLYGSSAMGGVINVITRQPAEEPETRINLNYGFFDDPPFPTGYQGYHDFHTLEVSHSRRMGNFSYLLDGSWKANDGHREKSGFDLYNVYGKARWQLTRSRYLQVSGNINHIFNDTPATWLRASRPYSVAEHRKDDFQNRREYNADVYYYALPTDKLKYSTRLYYYQNHSRFSFNDDPGNDSTNVNFGKQPVDRSSIRAQRLGNITQVDLFTDDGHNLMAGLDVKWDGVVGLPDTVLYGRHQAIGLGLFVQDEFTVSEKLIATLGARLDHYNIIGEFEETNFSPKLALSYRPSEKLSFRFLIAQAFRNPAMAERYIKFTQGGGLRFRPNPGLRAERLDLSLEWGSRWQLSRRSSVDVALFYNRYKNLIGFQQISRPLEPLVYEVINLKEAVMQGVELSWQQQWNNILSTRMGYTFLDARDVSVGRLNDELPYKVRHSFSFSATARHKGFTLNINSRYRSAIREVSLYPGSEPGAAFLINSRLGYRFNENFSAFLASDNMGNLQYEELERYRMPGRSWTAGVQVRI